MQETALKICSRGKYIYIPSPWSAYPQALASQSVPYPGIKSAKLNVRMKSE